MPTDNGPFVLAADIARSVPALLFSMDARGRVTFTNERWTETLGCTAESLLGDGWTAFVHPDDVDAIRTAWRQNVDGGKAFVFEARLRRADGTFRWFELRAQPETHARLTRRWFGAAVDVDVRRRALDALDLLAASGGAIGRSQDITAVLTRMAETSLGGIADISIFDLQEDDGAWQRFSVCASEISKERLKMVNAFQAPNRSEPHPIARAMAQNASIFEPVVDEAFIQSNISDPKRREAWRAVNIRSIVSVPLIAGDRLVGALTLLRVLTNVPFDDGDVRVLEEVGRRAGTAIENVRLNESAQREAQRREERFRHIADSIPQLMWTADARGRLDWCNERWRDYTGQTLEEALATSWTSRVHPDAMAAANEQWAHSVATGQPFDGEYRLRGHDRVYRWFLSRAIRVVDNREGATWYGSHTEIDSVRRAARTLQLFAHLGEVLSESLGLQATMDAVMHMLVPEFADWAFFTLIDDDGARRVASVWHAEPDRHTVLGGSIGRAYESRGNTSARFWPIDVHECLEFPLLVGSVQRGTLNMCLSEPEQTFDTIERPFFEELARRVAPAIANAELYERERRVAQSFQEAALPNTLPAPEGYRFDAVYEAGRAEALVGGDWYDAFELRDGRIVISVGDVAGSGLRAAVTMASVRQAIRGVAHVHADPLVILEAANRVLLGENVDRFVTAFVGVIDTTAHKLTYQSAGHLPPLLRRADGRRSWLALGGLPLGLREHERTPPHTVALPRGSLLVAFTDGLVESTHDLQEGERRVFEALGGDAIVQSDHPAKALFDALMSDGPKDDVAILTVFRP